MTASRTDSDFTYRAFISYSHQDKAWADWLHKALETWRVPHRLVGLRTRAGVIPPRLTPIFRDRDELASATDLNRQVNAALGESAHLIVICSPRSASSHWVNEEVLAFKRLGGNERILCLIVDGEPDASELPGREAEECFAPALRFTLDADGEPTRERTEPIAADARPGQDGKANAKLRLIAGLLDVGYDTLKQRELQRRNRRLAAIAAAAVVVMIVTTTLAVSAVIARNDAERRQKQAEALIGFMLGNLSDKLQQVSRLDIMEAVDDKAMGYFESLPARDVTDDALVQRAKALEKIGAVRLDQGRLPAAMESFRAAGKFAGALADAAPHDAERQIAYSRVLAYVGMVDWGQGNLDAAQHEFESAQAILQRATSQSASDPQLIFQQTLIDNNIGHVLEARGQLEPAVAQYRIMLAHCKELVAGGDAKSTWMAQLGSAYNNLGGMALVGGDLATAVAEYRADDAIETQLSARDPRDNDQRGNMMRVRAILGRTLALTGDVDTGTRYLQQAVDMAAQLLQIDPSQSEFRELQALYSSQLGRLRRLSGDLRAAATLTTQSLAFFSALTRQDPANTGWRRELAEAQTEQAAQSFASGNVDLARAQVEAALISLDTLLSSQPDDRATVLATAGATLLLAGMTDDARSAQHLRESALDAMQSAKSGAADPRLLALEVAALLGLDRTAEATPLIRQLWTSGYSDPAMVAMLQRVHIDYPANAAFAQRLQAAVSETDRP